MLHGNTCRRKKFRGKLIILRISIGRVIVDEGVQSTSFQFFARCRDLNKFHRTGQLQMQLLQSQWITPANYSCPFLTLSVQIILQNRQHSIVLSKFQLKRRDKTLIKVPLHVSIVLRLLPNKWRFRRTKGQSMVFMEHALQTAQNSLNCPENTLISLERHGTPPKPHDFQCTASETHLNRLETSYNPLKSSATPLEAHEYSCYSI